MKSKSNAKPKLGLSLMPTEDFWQSAAPLHYSNKIEVIEWSFDMPWNGATIPDWCAELLREYSEQKQLLGHGVTWSLLSAQETTRQQEWLERLKKECQQRSYIQISEHFGFTEAGPFVENAPLPVPFTNGFLRVGKQKLRQLSEATQLPIGIENLAFAFCLRDVLDQGRFLAELLSEIDGFLVLDLHNIYCQSNNFDIDPKEILQAYPLEKVREIHVSGGSWSNSWSGNREAVRRDTHDGKVPEEVLNLIPQVLSECPEIRFVIMERIGGSMFDEQKQIDFRSDYEKVAKLIDSTSDMAAIWPHQPKKTVSTDDELNLTKFQDNLVTLLNSNLEPPEILQRLRSEKDYKSVYTYVEGFDIDMISVASELVKKWGK